MAYLKLSAQDLVLMRQRIQEGYTPLDIASEFNIAVSSVPNYRKIFAAMGDSIPNLRGKRPKTGVHVTERSLEHILLYGPINGSDFIRSRGLIPQSPHSILEHSVMPVPLGVDGVSGRQFA